MPTYILRNTETDEQFEEFCTWDELDKFLNENPKFQQVPSAPHMRILSFNKYHQLLIS